MRHLIAGAAMFVAVPAWADIVTMEAQGSVSDAADRLEAAIEEAGATVMARVDHGGGAAEAGLELGAAELVVFGNPQVGTPVMQEDIRAGLFLPLKILVYEAEGTTMVAYEEPGDTFEDLDIDDDLEALEQMSRALEALAGAAAGN